MAPSRRRGSGKASSAAAAAAAAKKQWKVGDLVLAKVKGFPAWPATVSEPEKWGFPPDWKKVLVYFFGTKQIAFCNPADVEAFTEEKKKSMLTKRQGKGADFVRAVEEIIDCFEKSKQEEVGDEFNSGDEGTVSNAGHYEGSVDRSWNKVQTKNSIVITDPQFGSICATTNGNNSHAPVEVAADGIETAVMHKTDTVSEEHIGNAMHLKETKIAISNTLRKRSREQPVPNSAIQPKAPSVRRSRSSLKVDSCKLGNHILPTDDDSKTTDILPNIVHDESIRKNRRILKSPNSSVWHDRVSPVCSVALGSNGSSEDNASEIVLTNSDAISMNEGSTLESTCQNEHSDVVGNNLQSGVQVSEALHSRDKAVVCKKKRRLSRKRVAHGAGSPTASPGKESHLVVALNKSEPISPNASGKLSESVCKADGDEHLPLVKRARVRMGKLPLELKEHNKTVNEEQSLKDVLINNKDVASVSSSFPNNAFSVEVPMVVKVAANGSTPTGSSHGSVQDTPFWRTKKFQLRGCSADGESALPPSKRLHRALEAMSANVAEDVQDSEAQDGTTTIASNHCSHFDEKVSHTTTDARAEKAMELQDVKNSSDNDTCMSGRSGSLPSLTSPSVDVPVETLLEPKPCDCMAVSPTSLKKEICEKMVTEARDFVHVEDLNDSSLDTQCVEAENHVRSSLPSLDCKEISNETRNLVHSEELGFSSCSPQSGETEIPAKSSLPSSNLSEKQSSLESPPVSLIRSASSLKTDHNDVVIPCTESSVDILKRDVVYSQAGVHSASSPEFQRTDTITELNNIDNVSAPIDRNVQISIENGGSSESTENPISPPDEDTNVKQMCEVVKEVQEKSIQEDDDSPSYATSMKGLIAAAQAMRQLSRATSLSDNPLDDKHSYTVQSPSVSNRTQCSQQVSPRSASICHQSTLDNGNDFQLNCSRSPNLLPHCKTSTHLAETDKEGNLEMDFSRQRCSGKFPTAEADAARKSFEAFLGTLSRTKDSIGRATRLAIDCAKYGIAGEVMNVIVRSLESESSLHRRVDLFFLVDSITQCCRGQKGDFGDTYSVAVQAALPRLLSAAAPPGNAARENRRQCLKVLKLWLERRTLPESVIRHHMRELDDASFPSTSSRRPSRTERAIHDPIREMEGMHVDEYGSNANIQLAGFLMPRLVADAEGSDSDDKSFEAVTPEHNPEFPEERKATPISAIVKHHHILEDVDGELEMEDLAPSCIVDNNACYHAPGVDSMPPLHCQIEQCLPMPFAPPLPEDKPPTPPPLPKSPPPVASSQSALPPPLGMHHSFVDNAESNHYVNSSQNTQNCLQRPISQQPSTPSFNTSALDAVNYYGPGYRDFVPQIQRPGSSSSSDPCCNFVGPHPSIQTGFNAPKVDASMHNKNYHLHPPPPVLSNQFSYVQADQRAQSWMEASSSSFGKRFHFGHDVNREDMYDNRDRMVLSQHDIGERCRLPGPAHSGPVHSDNGDASYAPASYYGPPPETNRMMNREWSWQPRTLNYRHSRPLRPPESATSRGNGVANFWRPR